jgi:hypothetical protein
VSSHPAANEYSINEGGNDMAGDYKVMVEEQPDGMFSTHAWT